MAEKCIICEDGRRADIDKALGVPRSDSKVSREFGFSRPTIARHRAHIVPIEYVIPQQVTNSSEIAKLKAVTQRIIDTTRDDKVRIAAVREMRGYLELEARLQQEAQGTSALESDPAYQQIVSTVVATVCGECRGQIDASLRKLIGTTLAQGIETPIRGGIPAPED